MQLNFFAVGHGLISTRLRDLGRFGMLYTPSWNKVARKRIVSEKLLEKIQHGGRQEIFYKEGGMGESLNQQFDISPVANSYQWDAVFPDGDFYKSGMRTQRLYVSPGNDVVIACFSTSMHNELTGYSQQIAKFLA